MKSSKKKHPEREKRVKVGLNLSEYLELQRAAQVQNISMSDVLRSQFLKGEAGNSAQSDKLSLHNIDSALDLLGTRISKIERVLRMLVVNTAIARGHASGVLELAQKSDHDVLHNRMIEARDQQKKMFFELFPDLREVQQ